MASGNMMYIPDLMMIGSGIQVILRFLTEQFERLQCWYYRFVKYTIDVGSGDMLYMPSFIKTGSGIQKFLGRGDTQTARCSHKATFIVFLKNKESTLRE
jgi:hypothetical protein